MKIITSLTGILFILISCSNPTNKSKPETEYLKVEKAILDFAKAHPNLGQNDVLEKELVILLRKN